MLCIISESNDPFFNLAVEEVLLKNEDEEYFMLSINNPSVIIGKHQVTNREINIKHIIERNIPVIRRISGGGTVFHDRGNLNFSFILHSEAGKQVDFRKYTLPVIGFLSSLGVDAEFTGKSDLTVKGLKISGNAEHVYHNRILHHGTLLYDSSLGMLKESLKKDYSCYSTRAVKSNPSQVTNLAGMVKDTGDIYMFRNVMMRYILKNMPGARLYQLSSSEKHETEMLVRSKYMTWDWNWAYGPGYSFSNRFLCNGRSVTCHLDVNNGIVGRSVIEDDHGPVEKAEKLKGCRHMVPDFVKAIKENKGPLTDVCVYDFF